jgi:hypothetical protein
MVLLEGMQSACNAHRTNFYFVIGENFAGSTFKFFTPESQVKNNLAQ